MNDELDSGSSFILHPSSFVTDVYNTHMQWNGINSVLQNTYAVERN